MGIALYATSLLLDRKLVKGSVVYLISVALKFATGFGFLGFLVLLGLRRAKYIIEISTALMAVAVIVASLRTNFQPWYLLYVMPFAVLRIEKRAIKYSLYILSIAGVLYYIPFLYSGNWDPPIPMILNYIILGAAALCLLVFLIFLPHSKKETN